MGWFEGRNRRKIVEKVVLEGFRVVLGSEIVLPDCFSVVFRVGNGFTRPFWGGFRVEIVWPDCFTVVSGSKSSENRRQSRFRGV